MSVIIVNDLLNAQTFKQDYETFRTISACDLDKIEVTMEVLLRRIGETFRARIEEINDQIVIATVLTETFYFDQPFSHLDQIQFEKENIIDIYDIKRTGVLL